MSGGVAYVYDPEDGFAALCNQAQADIRAIGPGAGHGAENGWGEPQQRARSVEDTGMGDPLYHDAARLRVLVERHLLHTGSARAEALLADWEASLRQFKKVMPRDYETALQALEAERGEAAMEAAE